MTDYQLVDKFQPDSSVTPYFDSLLEQTDVNDTFSMQLCGTIDTSNGTDVGMGGTLVSGEGYLCRAMITEIVGLSLDCTRAGLSIEGYCNGER